MTKKWARALVIVVLAVIVLTSGIYTYFNGTFWGKASAEKQINILLQKEYQPLKFHVGKVGYNFEDRRYDVGVVFNKLPEVKYIFEFVPKTKDLGYVGYTRPNMSDPMIKAPAPVPYATSWILKASKKTSNQITWDVKSITVSPAQMTVANQQLHAFRYIITMTPKGQFYGNPPNLGRPFTLQIHFSGISQKILNGMTTDTTLLSLANRDSLTYRAIWESTYLPTPYPKGTLQQLSASVSDVTVKVQSGS